MHTVTELHRNAPAVSGEYAMVRVLSFLAVALLLVTASAQAQQASRLDDIIKRGSLRVGMTGDYLPFSSLDKDDLEIPRLRRRHGGGAGQGARRQGRICPHRLAAIDAGFRGRQFRHRDGRRLDHARPAEEGPVLDADHARGQDADRALRRQGQIRDHRRYRQARHARHRQSRRHQRTLCQGQHQERRDQESATTTSRSSTRSPRATPT